MKWSWFILMLFIIGMVSCTNRGARGLQCSKGKGRKAKTYRIKKMKSYPRGYQVSRGSSPTNQTAKQEEKPEPIQPEEAFAETIELEGFPPKKATLQSDSVQIQVFKIPKQQEQVAKQKPKQDTIYRRTVERRVPSATRPKPKPEQEIIQQAETPDTIFKRTTVRISKQTPEEFPPIAQEEKDTLYRQTVIRQVNIPLIEPIDPIRLSSKINVEKIEFKFDSVKQLMFKNHVFEKDEDFQYYLNIPFVPNFDIFLYPDQAEKELEELVVLLKKYPHKKVYIYGNGGMDNADELSKYELHFQDVPEDYGGGITRILYGKNTDVYEQYMYHLTNTDKYELKRIDEEGRKKLATGQVVKLGPLLHKRAQMVEDYLESRGINRNRIVPKRGEFLPRPNATVKIKVLND